MANLKSLVKDTAIYGLSSIVGRFLNYLLVPLYTNVIPAENGDYGITTNLYAYTALILVLLTFGMETTFFRFANKEEENPESVFSTAMLMVSVLSIAFMSVIAGFITPISNAIGYSGESETYILMMAAVVTLDAIQALPFSYLRYKKKAIKFALLKMLFIIMNISLNLIYFLYIGGQDVYYIFGINLVCTALITFFFIPEMLSIKWSFDVRLLKRMLSYSWPIMLLGVVGILNQTADKMIFPLVYPDAEEAKVQLGLYGACVKVAMIMAMITQAFRYAYEPFVFAQTKEKDKNETYAVAMKYFIIFTLLAFLCVMGYLDILQLIIGIKYRVAMKVVPVVMAAEIMMGIYFNLSFWYKMIDKTIYGAIFSIAGCVVLFAILLIFIPEYSYWACAWGGFGGYMTAMILSYIVGQKKNPINYPMKSIGIYTLMAVAGYVLMTLVPEEWPIWLRLGVNTIIIGCFAARILTVDLPLKSMLRKIKGRN